ncbi:hypothetical protein AG1IA_10245 [Rhizoctonia solani AG-1 IA]|uniref:Uncharacterized protein n=1 Tax=Thanatephorus cucumeris (strain AG1-IA) TaxID=983506 RepID=L8WCQ0_THACA|nr:hypothetical protein AG1IA_10245 [Rhizoctonia solani AG-1 IA]
MDTLMFWRSSINGFLRNYGTWGCPVTRALASNQQAFQTSKPEPRSFSEPMPLSDSRKPVLLRLRKSIPVNRPSSSNAGYCPREEVAIIYKKVIRGSKWVGLYAITGGKDKR